MAGRRCKLETVGKIVDITISLLDAEGIIEALAVWEERLKNSTPDIVVNVEVAR